MLIKNRVNKEGIKKAYRTKALTAHPNKGGSTARFQALGLAKNQANTYIGRSIIIPRQPNKNFKAKPNLSEWRKLTKRLGRSITINNINNKNNENFKLRKIIDYYTSFNNTRTSKNMLNYKFYTSFGKHAENKHTGR